MLLPTTLSLAAAAAIINLWLSIRCGTVRAKEHILYGDGGDELLVRRMRAHANFVENTPIMLILAGVIELAGKGGQWLPIIGGIYMLGRISHGIGMDGKVPARSIGATITMLTLLGLAIVAILVVLGKF